jgi:hypothetical protein
LSSALSSATLSAPSFRNPVALAALNTIRMGLVENRYE